MPAHHDSSESDLRSPEGRRGRPADAPFLPPGRRPAPAQALTLRRYVLSMAVLGVTLFVLRPGDGSQPTLASSMRFAPPAGGPAQATPAGVWLMHRPAPNPLNAVDLVAPGVGLAVGNRGSAYSVSPAGIAAMQTGVDRDLLAVDVISATEAVAVGRGGLILRLSDGTWTTEQDGVGPDFFGVAMKNAGEGWVVGADGAIFHLKADGWTKEDPPDPINLYDVDVAPDGAPWAVGEQGEVLSRVADEWVLVADDLSLPFDTTGIVWRSVDAHLPNGLWVAGTLEDEELQFGVVARLLPGGGDTVDVFDRHLSSNPGLHSVSMMNAAKGWAVGAEGTLLSFDGQEWAAMSSPDCFVTLRGVAIASDDIWAVGQSRGVGMNAVWRHNPGLTPTATNPVEPTPTHDHHPGRDRRLTMPPKGQRPLAALAPSDRNYYFDLPPLMAIDPNLAYTATFETELGRIDVALDAKHAPLATNNFVLLALNGFYDGLVFHRVIADYVAQGGDPAGDGTGDPGYAFGDELDCDLRFDQTGRLAMANAGPGTNGSQFFFTMRLAPWLDGMHTIFGTIASGEEILPILTIRNPTDTPNLPASRIHRVLILPFDQAGPPPSPLYVPRLLKRQ